MEGKNGGRIKLKAHRWRQGWLKETTKGAKAKSGRKKWKETIANEW
jgi:hypothetical protein